MRSPRRQTLLLAVLLLVGMAAVPGCSSDSGDEAATAADSAFEGMSVEEMERQASQMTPAEAESLGIVDTTIRVEPPINPDTAFIAEGIRRSTGEAAPR